MMLLSAKVQVFASALYLVVNVLLPAVSPVTRYVALCRYGPPTAANDCVSAAEMVVAPETANATQQNLPEFPLAK